MWRLTLAVQWYVFAIVAGMVSDVFLLIVYVRWFRRGMLSEPLEAAKRLSTFYIWLAAICFLPIVSPAYWISVNPLFWDVVRPFLPPLYHGAGIAMMFVFFLFFSLIFCLLSVGAATWIPRDRGRHLGLFVSALYAITGVLSLWSLYPDLVQNIADPSYAWLSYPLYMLANLSLAIANVLIIYYFVTTAYI